MNGKELNIKYTRKEVISIILSEVRSEQDGNSNLDNISLYKKMIEIIKSKNLYDNQELNDFIDYINCYEELVKLYENNYYKSFMKWTNPLHEMQYKYIKLIEEMQDTIFEMSNFSDIYHTIWQEYKNQKIEFDFIRATDKEIEILFDNIMLDIASDIDWEDYWEHIKENVLIEW